MIRGILYLERLNFLLRGPALAAMALLALSFIYAGWSGDRWRDAQLDSLDAYETEKLSALADWRSQLAVIESGEVEPSPYDANPMSISFPAVLRPASLGDFAIGHADLHPTSAEISPWRNLSSVFGRYQFDNPTTLATSAFDVALVVVVLMPILMIAVSFDVLASERGRSSLPMVLATPVRLSSLVWTRLAFRNGLLWLVAVVAMFGLAMANNVGGDRFDRLTQWLAASLLYGLVWFTLIGYCVARFRSATATAGSLVGLWLLFTLALPATFATLAEALYPTPSRLAFLSEIREAQSDTNQQLSEVTSGFLLDHPELTVGDDSLPAYFRAAFLSNQAARDATQPIVDAYTDARAGRERTIAWAQYLSPSIIAQRLLMQSAGADLGRQHRYQTQVQASLATLGAVVGPAVVSRNRLSLAEFDGLKPFEFNDLISSEIARSGSLPSLFLLLLSILVGFAAQRRLARERLDS
ncbi:MAG: DUF3526 domain-containing protein [Pseudomonadota bacterium]